MSEGRKGGGNRWGERVCQDIRLDVVWCQQRCFNKPSLSQRRFNKPSHSQFYHWGISTQLAPELAPYFCEIRQGITLTCTHKDRDDGVWKQGSARGGVGVGVGLCVVVVVSVRAA